jgi:iron complex outermembrane receptor protein
MERWRKYPFPLELEAGLRYDYQLLSVEELPNGDQVGDRTYANVSATAGAIFHWNEHVRIRTHFGTAFRSPHPNELYSDGVHHGAASYERGNPQLKAEQARQLDLGILVDKNEVWQLDASVYVQHIKDFIFLEPESEPVLTIRGAFPAFRYAQADARLLGADVNLILNPTTHWQLRSGASFLRARNLERDEWLTFMPADRWQAGLRYGFGNEKKQVHYIGLNVQHRFRQERLPLDQDFASAPAAYTLLELEATTELQIAHRPLQLHLQVFNLTNVAYRDYLDRFRYFADAAGRNIALSMRMSFE